MRGWVGYIGVGALKNIGHVRAARTDEKHLR